MGSLILKIIGLLIVLGGVILIYDARIITKKFFTNKSWLYVFPKFSS